MTARSVNEEEEEEEENQQSVQGGAAAATAQGGAGASADAGVEYRQRRRLGPFGSRRAHGSHQTLVFFRWQLGYWPCVKAEPEPLSALKQTS